MNCKLCDTPMHRLAQHVNEDGHTFEVWECASAGTGQAPRGRSGCVRTRSFVPVVAPTLSVPEGEGRRAALRAVAAGLAPGGEARLACGCVVTQSDVASCGRHVVEDIADALADPDIRAVGDRELRVSDPKGSTESEAQQATAQSSTGVNTPTVKHGE